METTLTREIERSVGEPKPETIELETLALDLALEKMVEAFESGHFQVDRLRKIFRACEESPCGPRWKTLKLAHCTDFEGMKQDTVLELATTTVRLFGLSRTLWGELRLSRLRRMLAFQCDHDSDGPGRPYWITDLRDKGRNEPRQAIRRRWNLKSDTVEALLEDICEERRALPVPETLVEKWGNLFMIESCRPPWRRVL